MGKKKKKHHRHRLRCLLAMVTARTQILHWIDHPLLSLQLALLVAGVSVNQEEGQEMLVAEFVAVVVVAVVVVVVGGDEHEVIPLLQWWQWW